MAETLKICKHSNGYGYCFLHEEYCSESPCPDEELLDYEPVKHGRWIMRGGKRYCSVCQERACVTRDSDDFWYAVGTNYCPNCGAKMGGESE